MVELRGAVETGIDAGVKGILKNVGTLVSTPQMWRPWARWISSRLTKTCPDVQLEAGGTIGGFETFSEFWAAHGMRPTDGEMSFISRYLPKDGLALDIGANSGAFSISLAIVAPEATIHAFEPAPATFARLATNVEMNRLSSRIKCHQQAITEKSGTMLFTAREDSSGTNHLVSDATLTKHKTVEVNVTSVDDFMRNTGQERIDIIKIDVEGFEPDVLRGASETLSKRRATALLIELCPGNLCAARRTLQSLFEAVQSVGWQMHALDETGTPQGILAFDDARKTVLTNVAVLPRRL